jgi:branched-chain amino acid transport system ATP-binding protein
MSESFCNPGILSIKSLYSGYRKKEVLRGVSVSIKPGSIVAMIGPNGSGKSTVLKTVFGLVKAWNGQIHFDGASCIGQNPPDLIMRGLVYIPQGNLVFEDLTVKQNLTVSLDGIGKEDMSQRIEEMSELFPAIRNFMHNKAAKLSGGEKQQISLAIGLMKKPKMLLLDEPSLGLAPKLLGDVFEKLHHVNKDNGVTMLIVEHKVREVFKIADWVLGLRRGEIIAKGSPEAIDDAILKELFLG